MKNHILSICIVLVVLCVLCSTGLLCQAQSVGCIGGAAQPRVALKSAHPDLASIEKCFDDASASSGVPVAILKAVAYKESAWVHDGPTCDFGYGVMHLVDNNYCHTLKEAASLTGFSESDLKSDPIANIRAGAALIAKYAKETVGEPKALEDYWEALKKFSGLIDDDLRESQAEEYYGLIRDGFNVVNGLGQRVKMLGTTVDISTKMKPKVRVQSDDYAPAIWNQADSTNFTASRSAAVDRWVNHWVGTGSYAGAISWFKNPASNVSAHFVCRASDGQLTQMVRFAYTAWHCSTWNSRSIGIEHEATPVNPQYWSSQPMLNASSSACKFACEKYGFPKTRSYIVGHKEVPNASTACPGNLPWDTYIALVNGGPADPKFINGLTNGGFESDMTGWTTGASTVATILTSGAHGGSKACQVSRADATYATIWQNSNEVTGTPWRTTCWAYALPGMSASEFGFKDTGGVTKASVPVTASNWSFHSVDWTIAADVDTQIWGNGSTGLIIDDVRSGPVEKMNWIPNWIWNGTYDESLATDYLAADGGEANVVPKPGDVDGGKTWTEVNAPDGFVNLAQTIGGGLTNCSAYGHVYVRCSSAKNVNLLVGSDDGIKVWLNGALIHTNDVNRGQDYSAPDQDMIQGLTLYPGDNRLMVKVRQSTAGYSFSARFCDSEGKAISGLAYSTSGTGILVQDTIIESRAGGKNFASYSEEGTWADSASNCVAPGCTGTIGQRYGSTYRSVANYKAARFRPNITSSGLYNVYVAWGTGSNRRSPITHKVYHWGDTVKQLIDQTATANVWVSLGQHAFAKGTDGYVEVSNEDIDVSGSMHAAAAKFEFVDFLTDPTVTPTPPPTDTPTPEATLTPTNTPAASGNWFMLR